MPQTKTKRGKPKNEALDHLRSMTRSLASTIGLDDDEDIARPISGFMSQYMGIDPDTGQLTETAMRNLKRIWNADARKKAGLPKEEQVWPGMLEDTVSLPAIFTDSVPDANAAAERAGAIHDTVRSDMGLRAPEGFRENALDAGGVMLGQLPIPSSKAKAAASGAMGWMKKIAGAPLEFFSPTVEPGIGNYLSGSLFGGGLGALADNPDSISPYLRALMTTELPGDPRVPSIHKGKGGKVGALSEFLRMVSMNPEASLKDKGHALHDPLEDVLYAARKGVDSGKLSPSEHAELMKLLGVPDEDPGLYDQLINLHTRLFPERPAEPTYQAFQSRPLADDASLVPTARGLLTQDEWERDVLKTKKAEGGKVKLLENLMRLLRSHDINPQEFDLLDENGNLRVQEAKEVLEDAIEGEREVDDLKESLGATTPEDLTEKVRQKVNPKSPRRKG